MICKFNLNADWQSILGPELSKNYFAKLQDFVLNEYQNQTVYPKQKNIFRALNECSLAQTKVVIIGQDPYHGAVNGHPQAQGLSFSVPEGFPLPPSLRNIFKELSADLDQLLRRNGDLVDWGHQGVLLLNATLTVRANQAGSHQQRGWEQLTDRIIQIISEKKQSVVFILWGNYARQKKALIDPNRHLTVEAPHPSPLSANRGFFGSRPFSQTNAYLSQTNQTPINWT